MENKKNELARELKSKFAAIYGADPTAIARAPGRLEILGNHTDYNEGLVLSAAVEQSTYFAIRPVEGATCRLFCSRLKQKPDEFSLDDLDRKQPGDWKNYVKGVLCELRKRGIGFGAFDAGIISDVPLSAGMSSSAALEVSACYALKEAFAIELPKVEWAKIGQGSENNYIGVKTGLLDQFSSVFGARDSLILCDFRSNKVLENVRLPSGYLIVVANSMIKHDLVDSDYNSRRECCESAVRTLRTRHPEIKALRDVDLGMLEGAKDILDIADYRRAKHVVGENARVSEAVSLIENGDMEGFGRLLFDSHASSMHNFENSCPELDYLVETASSLPGCVGARLSGGGFGGISIHFVREEEAAQYCSRIETAFRLRTGNKPQTLICAIGEGAEVLKMR